ncbi:MAG: hypothetical protein GC137_05145 [Alphaproteobacteria bacterium]|nr:hypothetical protein [Alphaproteobacteria bacterium]
MRKKRLEILLGLALVINIAFWFSIRGVQAKWTNVPPPPDKKYAASYGLGDKAFAHRLNGIMIQNFGDSGGRSTALKDYNYENLAQWFFLQHYLDPASDYIPYVAAYLFGSLQEPEKYRPVISYLETVGTQPGDDKWRWLAQATFMARYTIGDLDLALKLAEKLASLPNDDLPGWVHNMPGFIMAAQGEKEAAYALLLEILKSSADKMHPNEVNSTKIYICTRILSDEEAAVNPLCNNN